MLKTQSLKTAGLLAALFLCSVSASASDATKGSDAKSPLTTVAALDVPRYMGVWYEIAKFPNWFQRKCVRGTNATYALRSDGKVQVTNRCRTEGGETLEALGLAKQIGPATSPKLEVRFAPEWLSFLPLVWGDYWVVDLDDGYQLVAVSEPKRNYLWVLSRTPKVDPVAYQNLLERLRAKGFDLRALEVTQQD